MFEDIHQYILVLEELGLDLDLDLDLVMLDNYLDILEAYHILHLNIPSNTLHPELVFDIKILEQE
jgi:hypothetical protein